MYIYLGDGESQTKESWIL